MSDRHPNYQMPWARVRLIAGDKPGTMRLTEFGLVLYNGIDWSFLAPIKASWAGLPPADTVRAGTEATVIDCGGAIAVAGAAGWVFRPVVIASSSTLISVSGATSLVEQTAFSAAVPASLMGTKGQLNVETYIEFSAASANAKTIRTRLGGQLLGQLAASSTHKTYSVLSRIKNFGAAAQKNMDGQIFTYGGSGGGVNSSTVDTSQATAFTVSLQLAVTTESAVFHGYLATVQPGM